MKHFKHHFSISAFGDQSPELRLVDFQSHAHGNSFGHGDHRVGRALQIHCTTKLCTGKRFERCIDVSTLGWIFGSACPGRYHSTSLTSPSHSAIARRRSSATFGFRRGTTSAHHPHQSSATTGRWAGSRKAAGIATGLRPPADPLDLTYDRLKVLLGVRIGIGQNVHDATQKPNVFLGVVNFVDRRWSRTGIPRQGSRDELLLSRFRPPNQILTVIWFCHSSPGQTTSKGPSTGRLKTSSRGSHRFCIQNEPPGASNASGKRRELRLDIALVHVPIPHGHLIQRRGDWLGKWKGDILLKRPESIEDFADFGVLKGVGRPCQKLFLTLVLELPSLIDIADESLEPPFHLFMG